MEIYKEFTFDAAHRLPNAPAGHKCARLHGHSFRVAVHVRGNIDPRAGWVMLEDLETGKRRLVNSSSAELRKLYAAGARDRRRAAESALAQALCPVVEIRTDKPYIPALVRFFQHRKRRGVA